MSGVRVFAPGKLFVIGEYAVLDGERALVAAVDSGIECRLEPSVEGWRIDAPDLGVDAAIGDVSAESGASLLVRAIDVGVKAFPEIGPQRVTVRGRGDGVGKKVGLGGSAATVVAILGALAANSRRELDAPEHRRQIFELALAAHRHHQRGRGSGADVAASVYGGWIDYSIVDGGARVGAAAVPPGLELAAAWSGFSSDTAAGIESFDRIRGGRDAFLDRMRSGLARFWRALERGDRAEMLAALGDYGALLEDVATRLAPRLAPRMAELARAAVGCGVVSKSSGAVGGDCVIALGFDPGRLAAARDAWRRLGAAVLDVGIDVRGVRLIEAVG
ncbi:MAG: mevalonate kinase family protein, partial [Candidatus Binatia bacterium]